jgi:hypothetical protein
MHNGRGNGRGFDRTPVRRSARHFPTNRRGRVRNDVGHHDTRRRDPRIYGPREWPRRDRGVARGAAIRTTPRQIPVVGLASKLKWAGTFPAHFHFQIARRSSQLCQN